MDKLIKAGVHFFFHASFIADLRHAEFVLALNMSSFCSSFTAMQEITIP